MPIYEIAVRYYANQPQETSAQHKPQQAEQTQAVTQSTKERSDGKGFITPHKAVALAMTGAFKINQYVGELTENTVTQKRVSVGLTYTAFGIYALTNPVLAGIGAAVYTGNMAIQYGIRNYKENLSASYLRDLSGGTVKTGR
jgi:predicted MFS family arabinose efflux permease